MHIKSFILESVMFLIIYYYIMLLFLNRLQDVHLTLSLCHHNRIIMQSHTRPSPVIIYAPYYTAKVCKDKLQCSSAWLLEFTADEVHGWSSTQLLWVHRWSSTPWHNQPWLCYLYRDCTSSQMETAMVGLPLTGNYCKPCKFSVVLFLAYLTWRINLLKLNSREN